jgi:hypothetical protein
LISYCLTFCFDFRWMPLSRNPFLSALNAAAALCNSFWPPIQQQQPEKYLRWRVEGYNLLWVDLYPSSFPFSSAVCRFTPSSSRLPALRLLRYTIVIGLFLIFLNIDNTERKTVAAANTASNKCFCTWHTLTVCTHFRGFSFSVARAIKHLPVDDDTIEKGTTAGFYLIRSSIIVCLPPVPLPRAGFINLLTQTRRL